MQRDKRVAPRAAVLMDFARGTLLAFLIASAAVTGIRFALNLWYPLGLNYGEGVVLHGVRTVLDGRPLYPPLTETSYVAFIYMPLYVWVCAGLATLWTPSFLVGRVLAVAATAACAIFIYMLARREGVSHRWSLIGALLFITSTPVAAWGAIMRVDTVGLVLSLGGLVVMRRGASPAIAGLLFALAILCKQSMLAAPFGACLYLAYWRRWRDLRLLILAMAAPVVAVGVWQTAVTQGGFWFHVVTANRVSYSLGSLMQFLRDVPARHALMGVFSLAGACVSGARGVPRGPSLLTGYLAGACGVMLLAGKAGADSNYFLDYAAATSVLAAVGAGWFLDPARRAARPLMREALVAAALLMHTLTVTEVPDVRDYLVSLSGRRHVTQILRRASGPVLSDDPSLVVGAGKPLLVEPAEYTQMGLSGIWDSAPLVRELRQGAFSVVVLRFNPWDSSHRAPDGTWAYGRFSDEMVAAIREAYTIDQQWGSLRVLRPSRNWPTPGVGASRTGRRNL